MYKSRVAIACVAIAVLFSGPYLQAQSAAPGASSGQNDQTETTKTEYGKLAEDNVDRKGKHPTCYATKTIPSDPANSYTWNYRFWLPLMTPNCMESQGAPILNFFQVSGTTVFAHQVQYLYNSKQSTNQISADLFTGTFPGFQAILAATATAGSSQPAATTTGSAAMTATASTDSVDTAVSKLEQGGDFNVRFPVPFAYHKGDISTFNLSLIPNIGFTVNGLTSQATITESTEYNLNLPVEAYYELGSYDKTDGINNAVLYLDFKAGAELISPGLKTAIGLTSNRYFFLGQANAGVEFMKSIRIGFQYFFGPSQVYTVATSTGSTQTTGHLGGLHLVVSFTPKKAS